MDIKYDPTPTILALVSTLNPVKKQIAETILATMVLSQRTEELSKQEDELGQIKEKATA